MKLATLAATAVLALATAAPTTGRAAEIRLICSNGYHAVIDVIGPQYEKATGNKLVVSYGLAAALQKDIEGGAQATCGDTHIVERLDILAGAGAIFVVQHAGEMEVHDLAAGLGERFARVEADLVGRFGIDQHPGFGFGDLQDFDFRVTDLGPKAGLVLGDDGVAGRFGAVDNDPDLVEAQMNK